MLQLIFSYRNWNSTQTYGALEITQKLNLWDFQPKWKASFTKSNINNNIMENLSIFVKQDGKHMLRYYFKGIPTDRPNILYGYAATVMNMASHHSITWPDKLFQITDIYWSAVDFFVGWDEQMSIDQTTKWPKPF